MMSIEIKSTPKGESIYHKHIGAGKPAREIVEQACATDRLIVVAVLTDSIVISLIDSSDS